MLLFRTYCKYLGVHPGQILIDLQETLHTDKPVVILGGGGGGREWVKLSY